MDALLQRMDNLIGIMNDTIDEIDEESKTISEINGVLYPPNMYGKLEIKTKVLYDEQGNYYTVECPYCHEFTVVLAKHLNCKTFRHGAFIPKNEKHRHLINKYKPINPHESWQKISQYLTEKKIIGCGGAFKIIGKPKVDKTNMYAVSCGYGKQRLSRRQRKAQRKAQANKGK